MIPRRRVVLGNILHFLGESETSYTENGALIVTPDGLVEDVLPRHEALERFPDAEVIADHSNKIILPGFIDTHIHFAQTQIIAAYGEQLLQWLDKYAFPAEKHMADKSKASTVAKIFLRELLGAGTTTALVFGTVHPESVEAFFEESEKIGVCMIAGKVLMDREGFAPDGLRDTPQSAYEDTTALIKKWHGRGRLLYAVTPRFAITSSEEQLDVAGRLLKENKGVYLHTHMNENKDEISLVKQLFSAEDYCSVYEKHGLLGPKTVLAHCVHMTPREWSAMQTSDSALAFCPTSNLFLGSGLFDLEEANRRGIRVGLGTDVGGGTSFSQLQSLNEAYKVLALQGKKLDAFAAFRLATLGSARTLSLDSRLGNFEQGKEADFIALDFEATPLLAYRSSLATTLHEKLFLLMILGDERCVAATYVMGKKVFDRSIGPELISE